MSGSFIDSNVLLYLLSGDEGKRDAAKRLLESNSTVSVQVLNEISHVARRKNSLDWNAIGRFVESLVPLVTVVPLTLEIHRSARAIAERYGYGLYDSAIIAAALGAGCTTLFTEDMQHSQHFGTLRVVNPFR